MKVLLLVIFIQQTYFIRASLFQISTCLQENDQTKVLKANGKDSSTSLSLTNTDHYSPGNSCNFTFVAQANQFLFLSFNEIDTRPCELDGIAVYTPDPQPPLCGRQSCPSDNCKGLFFDNIPKATIQFNSSSDTDKSINHIGFHGTVTAYSYVDAKTGKCSEKERFQCANNRCIWEGFHCDGHNHCGDNSDERPGCAKTVWGVLVIILGVVCLCIFLPVFCFLAYRGPRGNVPIRIMGTTFFGAKENASVNDIESIPILLAHPLQGNLPGETYTFYYGATATNPKC